MEKYEKVSLKDYSSFRIGGEAKYLLVVESKEEVWEGIALAKERGLPWMILGNGSNVLFDDRGYDGVILKPGAGMGTVEVKGTELMAGAGARLAAVARKACEEGLSGLSFAGGIPGTVGGGLWMNAGAYGGEMKDVVKEAEVLMPDGQVRIFTGEELDLSYRHSVLQENGGIVLSVLFSLEQGDKNEILETMKDYNRRRMEKQPLEFASAGSTFRRPAGHYAGQLIEEAGLKGYRVGDAMVSEKHAGFVINVGNATQKDVLAVIRHIQDEVRRKFNVELETEVRIIPFQ